MPLSLAGRRSRIGFRLLGATLIGLNCLAGCGGPAPPAAVSTVETGGAATTTLPTETAVETGAENTTAPTASCASGRLTVGDLPLVDSQWRDGLATASELAQTWQPDAKLTSFRVGCELLEPRFRWQVTFYSPSSQAFFSSDTFETQSAELDPSVISALPLEVLSFGLLRRSLSKAGYDDSTELSPSVGVTVRLNSDAMPFGPPQAPKEIVLYHVAVIHRGEVKDLFVSSVDGTVYRYSF